MSSLSGFSFWNLFGSTSSDIPSLDTVENPLAPCPKTPNCIRITKEVEAPVDTLLESAQKVLKTMQPKTMTVSRKQMKIETVFKVLFFRDDTVVQISKKNATSSYLHLRSASRVGKSDLGVNRRRVKKFLKKLQSRL